MTNGVRSHRTDEPKGARHRCGPASCGFQPSRRPQRAFELRHVRTFPRHFRRDGAADRLLPARGFLTFHGGILCTTRPDQTLHLSLPTVLIAGGSGALLGAQAGYYIGRVVGPRLRERHSPRLRSGIARAEAALDRYGPPKAIMLARFIPVVRTVLNPLAGALRVPAGVFTLWQVVGGIVWSLGVTLAGYGLGSRIPDIDKFLLPIVAVVVLVSLLPVALEARREHRRTRG